jgi:hypothetical protein
MATDCCRPRSESDQVLYIQYINVSVRLRTSILYTFWSWTINFASQIPASWAKMDRDRSLVPSPTWPQLCSTNLPLNWFLQFQSIPNCWCHLFFKTFFFFACIKMGYLPDSFVAFIKHAGRHTIVSASVYCFWNDGQNLTAMLSYSVDVSIDSFRVQDAAVQGGRIYML